MLSSNVVFTSDGANLSAHTNKNSWLLPKKCGTEPMTSEPLGRHITTPAPRTLTLEHLLKTCRTFEKVIGGLCSSATAFWPIDKGLLMTGPFQLPTEPTFSILRAEEVIIRREFVPFIRDNQSVAST